MNLVFFIIEMIVYMCVCVCVCVRLEMMVSSEKVIFFFFYLMFLICCKKKILNLFSKRLGLYFRLGVNSHNNNNNI